MKKLIFNKISNHALLVIMTSALLSSCTNKTNYAPVIEATQQPGIESSTYRVHKGDTIYSIAWTVGLDYRTLASTNNLPPPYLIHEGQLLKIKNTSQPNHQNRLQTSHKKLLWSWPAKGYIIKKFSAALTGNRGINIAGRPGEPVVAAAPGKVVYSGDGIRGYGNLLIIKHNDSYLSAYAFNRKLLAKLDQNVNAGQRIAEMGNNDVGRTMLHFEIRRNGKPVDPERYLHS